MRTILVLGCFATVAWGHGPDEGVKAVPDAEVHRPSVIPDRIIRTFAGDPAQGIAVTWRTSVQVRKGMAELAKADAGPKFVKDVKSFEATRSVLKTDLGESAYHSVVFEGLEPATTYAYRVGDGVNWSEWVHARTAAASPAPFSFIYFGDAQNDIKSLWSRVIRGAYSDAPRAAFIVHAGDLINRANNDALWGEWFAAGGWVNAMVPSVPAPGNHEYERPAVPKTNVDANSQEKAKPQPVVPSVLSRHWRPQFTLPENGPEGLHETVYTFDYQGARFVVLNSNEQLERQARWLETVLKNNPNRWTVITFHHPVYSTAKGRDNPKVRDAWQPIFDRYKVDLVLQGHDHTYARSGLRTYENVPGGTSTRDPGGTVYVVSVSGPKMYDLERSPWMKRAAEDTQLYQIISIDGDTLRYQSRTAVGDVYDGFQLRKQAAGPNLLTEEVPTTPERRRPPAPKPATKPAAATVGKG